MTRLESFGRITRSLSNIQVNREGSEVKLKDLFKLGSFGSFDPKQSFNKKNEDAKTALKRTNSGYSEAMTARFGVTSLMSTRNNPFDDQNPILYDLDTHKTDLNLSTRLSRRSSFKDK